MKYFFIFFVSLVAILEVAGDILFKEWTINGKKSLLVLGVFLYMLATVLWAFSIKYQGLAKAVLVFGILTVVIGILVGLFIYKEPVTTLNIIGIILGIASIVLLEI